LKELFHVPIADLSIIIKSRVANIEFYVNAKGDCLKKYLEAKILERGLGSFSKIEWEVLVIYSLEFFAQPGSISPRNISGKDFYSMAQKYKISPSKMKSIILSINRSYIAPSRIDLSSYIKASVQSNPEPLKTGYIKMHIPNPAIREQIELQLIEHECSLDTSFNRDILTFPISNLHSLIGLDASEVCTSISEEIKRLAIAAGYENVDSSLVELGKKKDIKGLILGSIGKFTEIIVESAISTAVTVLLTPKL
jgi:hypothetical protein